MKNKKVLAIVICVGLLASSFSGVSIGYAYKGNSEDKSLVGDSGLAEFTTKAPASDVIEMDIEVDDTIVNPSKGTIDVFNDTNSTLDNADNSESMYEKKEKLFERLKNTYQTEYIKLVDNKLNEKQIISLLCYIDNNQLQLTDQLIEEYKEKGEKLFQQKTVSPLSKSLKEKYKVTEEDAQFLTDDIIKSFEETASKLNITVNELIKAYIDAGKAHRRIN